ncbi:hypothetical protein DFH08DRAFT_959155 [Mycena albidolilacea]|uniref:Uncharacterized protein n=1 Tax=Mycena albidolilacea TaxID=1033008 RepID=A0AAD7ERW1_9AGAR|nr:hypothetical protein DFH08DRAFT_959155 [Mycena albidolilacea]
MSSVYAARAKKWETNSFVAEWFSNAVAYCQTKEGKKAFEAWLVEQYGKEIAKQKLLDCQKPPLKRSASGNLRLFNAAAWDLGQLELFTYISGSWSHARSAGISHEAMEEYHLFTAGSDICVPPRTKPAPKRRRGETSAEWLARRHDALLAGCKVPDIDWRIARALAISEFDKARDTFEIWHSDTMMFLNAMLARAPTTLINPEIKVGTPEERIYRLDYAFRACLHGVTLSYMTWGHAVDVFEELDRRGLASTSAIERAYRQDSALMWRLVACLCRISYLEGHLWERFTEIMSWCEYYRPFFKRYRTPRGESRVEINHGYLKQCGNSVTTLDTVIIKSIETDGPNTSPAFFDNVLKCLDRSPNEATKFSNEAYQELGDIATANEFKAQMFDSAFGQRLIEFAESKDKQCLEDPRFLPNVTFIDPSKLHWLPRNSNDWSHARTIGRSLGITWLETTNRMSMADFFIRCIPWPSSNAEREKLVFVFDGAWLLIDTALWELSGALDRSGDKGTVARKFGLFDPADPERPTVMKVILGQVGAHLAERSRLRLPANSVPPPHSEKPGPAALIAKSTVASSGHAYVSSTEHLRAKEKVKTKGTALPLVSVDVDATGEEEAEEILPEVLPTDFKIGKKILKVDFAFVFVFHRILQAPDVSEAEDDQGPRMGQIRWGDFERAMKRIGFGIAQTAGSSVRFDPPAKAARPITFHRPHPELTLTPIMLRWIGARLQRCYGWTSATFSRAAADEE